VFGVVGHQVLLPFAWRRVSGHGAWPWPSGAEGRGGRLLGDQGFEEASGFDHRLPHVLGTARLVGRRVHAAVTLDVAGVVDGEGGDLVLEQLAVGEAAVPCQAGQQCVRLGDGLLR
jgi:hypothetical protein